MAEPAGLWRRPSLLVKRHMLQLLAGGIMVAVAHVPRRLSENRQPKNLPSIALPFLPETNVVPTMTRCVTSKQIPFTT